MMDEFDKRLVSTKDEALDVLLPEYCRDDSSMRWKYELTMGFTLISEANELIVGETFFEYYADFILKMLELADEDARLIICDLDIYYALFRYYNLPVMKLIKHLHSTKPTQYCWLHINRCRNKEFYEFMANKYNGGTMYFNYVNNSLIVPLLPATDFKLLDHLCNIIQNFY